MYIKTPLPAVKNTEKKKTEAKPSPCSKKPLVIQAQPLPNYPPPIKHPKFHEAVPDAIAPSRQPPILSNPLKMAAPNAKVNRFPWKLVKEMRKSVEMGRESSLETSREPESTRALVPRRTMLTYADNSNEYRDFEQPMMDTSMKKTNNNSLRKNRYLLKNVSVEEL